MADKKQLRVSLEFLGFSAVVLSLVLVAMELRQNTSAIEAQTILELNTRSGNTNELLLEYPELRDVWLRAFTNPDEVQELSADEQLLSLIFVGRVLDVSEAAWVFNERGLIDDEQLSTYRFAYCFTLGNATHQLILDSDRAGWRTDFYDEFIKSCDD